MTIEQPTTPEVVLSTALLSGKGKNVANLSWSLDVDCPACKETIDLSDCDTDDYSIARRIFTNEWGKLEGHEITCPHCTHEFALDSVEY